MLLQLSGPLPIILNAIFKKDTPKTNMTTKVSVVSEDGCVFKQESVNLEYTPPGSFFPTYRTLIIYSLAHQSALFIIHNLLIFR